MSGSLVFSSTSVASPAPAIAEIVKHAANVLVADLERAQALSRNWHDEDVGYEQIQAALSHCISQLATAQCVGEANRLPSSWLWERAKTFLIAGELQLRARTKPRGYAGDFELLKKICDQYRCADPLGRLFDRFFQAQAAPQAVRNRTRLLADRIVEAVRTSRSAHCKVVSVGCSAAVDVEWALAELQPHERAKLHVVLLDLDPAAIDGCERRLRKWLPGDQQLIAVRENLVRLPQQKKLHGLLADSQLLFCAGLFDYLELPAAAAMLTTFWQNLASDGRLLVFNFGHDNPSRGYMEWIGNWYLIYRSADEMQELARAAHLPPAALTVSAENSGVNLFLEARRGC